MKTIKIILLIALIYINITIGTLYAKTLDGEYIIVFILSFTSALILFKSIKDDIFKA